VNLRLAAILAMALSCGVTARLARAQSMSLAQAPRLFLDTSGCESVPAAAVRSIVSVELRTGIPDAAADVEATRVTAGCSGELATISIDDVLTHKSVSRVIDMAGTAPIARPHLLALAIVELLAASWYELAVTPAVQPVTPVAASPERDAALAFVHARLPFAPSRNVAVSAIVDLLSFGRLVRLWGGSVEATSDLRRWLAWQAALGLAHGTRSTPLGLVTADNASAALAVAAQARSARLSARVGLGLRLGSAWVSGSPAVGASAAGGSVHGLWWGPMATVGGSFRGPGPLVWGAAVEGGVTARGVVADVQGYPSTSLDGPWLRIGVGGGLAF
jgi:hypothetical protein